MNERRIHQIFQVSVILKGAHALIESVDGIALYLVSTDTILGLVKSAFPSDPKRTIRSAEDDQKRFLET
jgi:uncharacterized membrane protein